MLQLHFRRLRREHFPSRYSFRILRKDGEIRWVEIDSGMIHWEGNPTALICMTDITERKRAEESLKEANVFLSNLLNAIPLPIFYKDTDGCYIGFNKSFEEFFGKTSQELVGKDVFDIHSGDMAEFYHAQDLELFHNPGIQVYHAQMTDAHGAVHDVISHKSTFLD